MSNNANELNEIAESWLNTKNSLNFGSKIGNYVEFWLENTSFGILRKIFFIGYLFLYELHKTYELINLIFGGLLTSDFSKFFLIPLDHITIDYYVKKYYSQFFIQILVLFLNCVQIFIAILMITDYLSYDYKKQKINTKISKFRQIIYIATEIMFFNFSFSFNYVNLFLFRYYQIDGVLNKDSFAISCISVNTVSFIFWTFSSIILNYFLNDIDPTDNKFFNSVSRPLFNIINFLKFFLLNFLILYFAWLPKYVIVFFVLLYSCYLFYYYFFYVFIMNFYYNYHFLFRFFFMFCLVFFNSLQSLILDLGVNYLVEFNNIYYLISSFFISIILSYLTCRKREEKFYSMNKNQIDSHLNFYKDEELFIFYSISSKKMTHVDQFKHQSLCRNYKNLRFQDIYCPCEESQNFNKFSDESYIYSIKSMTLKYLSEFQLKPGLYHLFYINCLLSSKNIDYSFLTFIISKGLTNLPMRTQHLLVRIVKNFFNVYEKYSESTRNFSNFTPKTLSYIIKYEFLFMEFLKKVKKVFSLSLKFWQILRNKCKDSVKILNLGTEISSLSIKISHDYGKMMKINENQVKTLKIYSCFVNTILGDNEYSEVISGMIKETLQMKYNINYNNVFDKDFGILTVSGNKENQFQIINCNRFAQNLFQNTGKTIDLVKQNIHYFIPYPLNVYHNFYLKNQINLELLVNEKIMFLLNNNGDLVSINMNICPFFDFEGHLNFFNIFYLNSDESNPEFMKILIDDEGMIFAANKIFKNEFLLTNDFGINYNIKFFQDNLHRLNISNYPVNLLENYDTVAGENSLFFENFFDIFPKAKNMFETDEKQNLNQIKKFNSVILEPTKKSSKIVQNITSKSINKSKIKFSNYSHTDNSRINKFSIKKLDKMNKLETEGIRSLILSNNTGEYEFNLTKVTSFAGLFTYYTIIMKKLKNLVRIKTVDHIPENVNYSESLVARDLRGTNYASSMISSVQSGESKFKLSNFLQNYQNNKYGDLSQTPKIVKKIYFYLFLSMTGLLSVTILNIFQASSEINHNSNNLRLLSNFYSIRQRLYYLIMNVRSLVDLKKNGNNQDDKNNPEIIFVRESINYDLNYSRIFLSNLYLIDLTEFPGVLQQISSQTYNLSTLGIKTSEINAFSFASALNIYINKISGLISNSEFSISSKEYLNYYNKSEFNTSQNYIDLDFIFRNFFENFMSQLSIIGNVIYNDSNEILQNSKNRFQIRIICESLLYIAILLFIIDIVRNICFVHNFILNIFELPDEEFVNMHISNIAIIKERILDFKNDEKNLSLISKKLDYDLASIINIKNEKIRENLDSSGINIRRNSKIKEDTIIKKAKQKLSELIKTKRFSLQSPILFKRKSIAENQELNEISKATQTIDYLIESKNENKLIQKENENNQLFWDGKSIIHDEFRESKGNFKTKFKKYKFYLKLILIIFLFFLSFIYLFLFELIKYPKFTRDIDTMNNIFYLSVNKVESNLMMINSLNQIIINNQITYYESGKLLFDYYTQMLSETESNFTQNIKSAQLNKFMDKIITTFNNHYSSQFCYYFYNLSLNYLDIPFKSSFNECLMIFPEGLQIYLFQLKKTLNIIEDKFKFSNNHSLDFLESFLEKSELTNKSIILGYYYRSFFKDLGNSLETSFNLILNEYQMLSIIVFIIFIIHYSFSTYLIFTSFFRFIYFYFEKVRILISIFPRKYSRENRQLSNFTKEYF